MENLKSEGKCHFCNEMIDKALINKHFKAHFKTISKTNIGGLSYYIRVEIDPKYGEFPYFLYLLVSNKATMGDLDQFLKDIWLECCGHMSSFRDYAHKKQRDMGGIFDFYEAEELLEAGKIKQYEKLMEQNTGEIPMSRKVEKVFYKNQKLEYQYDYGSTTQLLVQVIDVLTITAPKKITLLSRNEPLELICQSCKKEAATSMCTIHNYEEDYLFCPKCAKKHSKSCSDFDDYAEMPVVNSPRMGVCDYQGGSIDVERDGAFLKK